MLLKKIASKRVNDDLFRNTRFTSKSDCYKLVLISAVIISHEKQCFLLCMQKSIKCSSDCSKLVCLFTIFSQVLDCETERIKRCGAAPTCMFPHSEIPLSSGDRLLLLDHDCGHNRIRIRILY